MIIAWKHFCRKKYERCENNILLNPYQLARLEWLIKNIKENKSRKYNQQNAVITINYHFKWLLLWIDSPHSMFKSDSFKL